MTKKPKMQIEEERWDEPHPEADMPREETVEEALRRELSDVTQRLDETARAANSLDEKNVELAKEVEDLKEQIDNQTETIEAFQDSEDRAGRRVTLLENEIDTLERALAIVSGQTGSGV